MILRGAGRSLWTSVLKLALPPQRHSCDTWLEHQEPFIHMAQNKREKVEREKERKKKEGRKEGRKERKRGRREERKKEGKEGRR